jgi:hypothetical protein
MTSMCAYRAYYMFACANNPIKHDSHEQKFVVWHGCSMVYFQTKNPNLGTFWRALEWKFFILYVNL